MQVMHKSISSVYHVYKTRKKYKRKTILKYYLWFKYTTNKCVFKNLFVHFFHF